MQRLFRTSGRRDCVIGAIGNGYILARDIKLDEILCILIPRDPNCTLAIGSEIVYLQKEKTFWLKCAFSQHPVGDEFKNRKA